MGLSFSEKGAADIFMKEMRGQRSYPITIVVQISSTKKKVPPSLEYPRNFGCHGGR